MKKLFILLFLGTILSVHSQEKLNLPIIVSENFQKQFSEVKNVGWSMFYRGKYNNDLRYEAEFLRGNSKYLVSYTKDGFVKAIQKSMPIGMLSEAIQVYIKENYPTFNTAEASVIVNAEEKSYYNVAIASEENYFILVFNKEGTFLRLTSLGDRI